MSERPLFRRGRASITIILEEPFELLIYCSKYGCDWRTRYPETGRFGWAPESVYFICHKSKRHETRKYRKNDIVEIEAQGVCELRRIDIRERESIDEIEDMLRELEHRCDSCDIVGHCLDDPAIEMLMSLATLENIGKSFSLREEDCYAEITEYYGTAKYEREYEGGVAPCFG